MKIIIKVILAFIIQTLCFGFYSQYFYADINGFQPIFRVDFNALSHLFALPFYFILFLPTYSFATIITVINIEIGSKSIFKKMNIIVVGFVALMILKYVFLVFFTKNDIKPFFAYEYILDPLITVYFTLGMIHYTLLLYLFKKLWLKRSH